MAEHTKEMSMTAETSNARGEWPARYMANGPQGTFYTDDLKLADALLRAYDEDDDWTVTEMPDPTGALAAQQPSEAQGVVDEESRSVTRQLLHWGGVPVHVTGTVTTSPGNWSLIDAVATQHQEPTT
jgi:hypothetical protein